MEARVVQIGTSVGVIVPKLVVKELELRVGHKLELTVNSRLELIFKKKKNVREGWLKAFKTNYQPELNYVQEDVK